MKAFEIKLAGYPIKLETLHKKYSKNLRFKVTYGQQIDTNLTYEFATQRLGEAILHALKCEGKLD